VTPHVPIMPGEVLQHLRPRPGEIAVDCTLGGGGHARAILERIQPGGRLIGLDLDAQELSRTEKGLRAEGFGPACFTARHASFSDLPDVLAAEGLAAADLILADLGVSSMQFDDPLRGFSYKGVGPLDMRMDPSRGESASHLLARLDERALAALLTENADEPHADTVARLLKHQPLTTTHEAERVVRVGLTRAKPALSRAAVKKSVRRTFQALRVAVNDEFAALDALLAALPHCLKPGGRVVVIAFHSGEDRRVKKAFLAGKRDGTYAEISRHMIQSSMTETRENRRSTAAKLRWAVRSARERGLGPASSGKRWRRA
jgi:16S rRNA (cytosine1402-N4)-methyltransferase